MVSPEGATEAGLSEVTVMRQLSLNNFRLMSSGLEISLRNLARRLTSEREDFELEVSSHWIAVAVTSGVFSCERLEAASPAAAAREVRVLAAAAILDYQPYREVEVEAALHLNLLNFFFYLCCPCDYYHCFDVHWKAKEAHSHMPQKLLELELA